MSKIAIFKDPNSSVTVIYTPEMAKYTTFIRSTEWAEVDFSNRSDTAETVAEEVAKIDLEIEKEQERLKALRARKTAVLSRVFMPAEGVA
jgi:hypothetical protein